ncbi:MAG: NAD(P)-dependent oxidoreductase [Sphingomonadaceae bacterium]|nr:NAD(P)-dependent oxidoreductase [Sphingomonadaceae bacterium]MDW8415099.1 NAD(P)-dependent oxidoreductase [Thermaurantiacus sp.]
MAGAEGGDASGVTAVIGGSGFVGRAVMRQLAERGEPAVNVDVVPPGPEVPGPYRHADITRPDTLPAALMDAHHVLLLAAEWRDNVRPRSRYREVNVDGVANVIAACREIGIRRLVFVSSCSVYGPTPGEVDEDFAGRPINPYGESKAEGERLLRSWAAAEPDVALVIVRPTVIFGPGNRGNVWNLANQVVNGPFLMIGDGGNRKSMAYVENVAAFLLFVRGLDPGVHVFNYADKPDMSMNELVAFIRAETGLRPRTDLRLPRSAALAAGRLFDAASRVLGREFGITSERIFKFCANTQYSAERARQAGFVPPYDLREGLRRMLRAEFGMGPGRA